MPFERRTLSASRMLRALAGVVLAIPAPAAAQQAAPRPAQQSTTAQQPVAPFAGFNPGRCVIAARVIDELVRRDTRDTGVYKPGTDTLFTVTTDSMRVCRAAFGRTTDDVTETLNQARTELLTREDSAAITTARRHLGTFGERMPGERAWELYLVVSDNMNGRPARLEQARAGVAELDRMGAAAASVRVLAHSSLASAAWVRYDDATVRAETDAVIAAWKELDEETQLWRVGSLASAYLTRAALAALTEGSQAAQAVLDTARGVVPSRAQSARAMIESAGRMYRIMDKPAASLEAAFWFNTGVGGPNRPSPGKVSIIVPAYRPCTGGCLSMLRGLKRFERRFGDRGLEITFHRNTVGFYVDTAPVSPFDEARHDSTYLLGQLELPGALAIAETEYSWRPDGRRQNSPTTNQLNYPGAGLVFVDRRGIIRYVAGGWQSALEARYAELIERLLGEEAAQP